MSEAAQRKMPNRLALRMAAYVNGHLRSGRHEKIAAWQCWPCRRLAARMERTLLVALRNEAVRG